MNDDANYIHIDDVREGVDYYCPCCRGLIKPRAYKKDAGYQKQPHFYHESGGCKEETYVHFICKNWLFNKGARFIINGNEHEVESIETEKTLTTSFGNYRPDIIVHTTGDKIFYFEIKATNRKSEVYAPKWDELGNDVVEVDVKEFINQKIKDGIPVFNLIYSGGECFIKSYTKKDYDETIAIRKKEWKRQDKLNYKVQWERLDWFWETLRRFGNDECNKENVISAFMELCYEDKFWCYKNIKSKSCLDLKTDLAECFKNQFKIYLDGLLKKYPGIEVEISHQSKLIYRLVCKTRLMIGGYNYLYETDINLKSSMGVIPPYDTLNTYLSERFTTILESKKLLQKKIEHLLKFKELPFIKSIHPISHYNAANCRFEKLDFKVTFWDFISSNNKKEVIGSCVLRGEVITDSELEFQYNQFKIKAVNTFEQKLFNESLLCNLDYQYKLDEIKSMFKPLLFYDFELKVSKNCAEIILIENQREVSSFVVNRNSDQKDLPIKIENWAAYTLEKINHYLDLKSECTHIVNRCKNKLWGMTGNYLELYLNRTESNTPYKYINMVGLSFDNYDNINTLHKMQSVVLDNMLSLLNYLENIKGIRLMEVRTIE